MDIKIVNEKSVKIKIGDWHIWIDDSSGERIIDEHRDAMLVKNNKKGWEVYDE